MYPFTRHAAVKLRFKSRTPLRWARARTRLREGVAFATDIDLFFMSQNFGDIHKKSPAIAGHSGKRARVQKNWKSCATLGHSTMHYRYSFLPVWLTWPLYVRVADVLLETKVLRAIEADNIHPVYLRTLS